MKTITFTSKLFRNLTLVILLALLCFRPLIADAAAPTCSERYLRDLGITVLNCEGTPASVTCPVPAAGAATPSTVPASKNVYILGDSITAKADATYKAAFSAKGLTATVDGSSSRAIDKVGIDGNKLTGLDAIDTDKTAVTGAGIIVIALGTNGGNTAANITKVLTKLRGYNATAPIYWVDTAVIDRVSYVPIIRDANRAIYTGATSANTDGTTATNYTVIPWFDVITPGVDAKNPVGDEKDIKLLISKTDGLNVHPTKAGVDALVAQVVLKTAGGETVTATNGGSCSTPGGSVLVGDDAVAKAYNYFISKGLQSFQSAAIVGNMKAESGVNPKRVEGAYFKKGDVCNGKSLGYPKEMDTPPTDNVFGPAATCDNRAGKPTGNVQPGYGLVQWSGGRRGVIAAGGSAASAGGLIAFAAADPQKRSPSDLNLQLDFVWQELQTGYKTRVYDPLVASTTIEVAVDIWVRKYEIPGGDLTQVVKDRTVLALTVLPKPPTN